MPRPATALNVASSPTAGLLVSCETSDWKALSVGIKAVRAIVPSVRALTGEVGFAVRTASTAAVRMSKFCPSVSKEDLAVRTEASDLVPRSAAPAVGAMAKPRVITRAEATNCFIRCLCI